MDETHVSRESLPEYLMLRCAMLGCVLILIMKATERSGRAAPADAKGPSTLVDDIYRHRRPVRLFHWSLAILIIAAGILHPFASSVEPTQALWTALPPSFGLLCLGFVISRFYWHIRVSSSTCCSDMRQFSRRLSLNVYLMLYVVIFVKEVVELVDAPWHDGKFDFRLFKAYLQTPDDQVLSEFTAAFGGYVACAVLAIVTIRALTAFYVRAAKEGVARPT
jgi:cytochrome b561